MLNKEKCISVDCEQCDNGYFINREAKCEPCPFTTYGTAGRCMSCPAGTMTPNWGLVSPKTCLKNEIEVPGQDWKMYAKPSGRNKMSLAFNAELDICEMNMARKKMEEKCNSLYQDLNDFDWDNITEVAIQHTICAISHTIINNYDGMCENATREDMQSIIDYLIDSNKPEEAVDDLYCMFIKPFHELKNKDPQEVCNNQALYHERVIDLVFSLSDIKIGMDAAIVVVPLLSGMRNLNKMNITNLGRAGRGIMDRFGMTNMTALTGLDIANDLKDMVFGMSEGFSIKDFDFGTNKGLDDSFWCKKGTKMEEWSIKRDCDNYCDTSQCRLPLQQKCWKSKLQCWSDGCNMCQKGFYYGQTPVTCKKCDFPEIEHGHKVREDGNGAEYKCDKGYNLKDCNGWAECHHKTAEITKIPVCVKQRCQFPDNSPSGLKKLFDSHNKPEDFYECRSEGWAFYECPEGKVPHPHDKVARCEGSKVNYPRCIDKCILPEDVLNGRVEMKGDEVEVYCNNGFIINGKHPWDKRIRCEWDYSKNALAASRIDVMCVPKGNCTFPDVIDNGARKQNHTEYYEDAKYARYYCPESYEMRDDNIAWCDGENGDQVRYAFFCKKSGEECFKDLKWPLTKGEDYIGEYLRCEDEHKFVLQGDYRPECGSAVEATCVARECDFPTPEPPLRLDVIKTLVKDGDEYKDVEVTDGNTGREAHYSCDKGYHLKSHDHFECPGPHSNTPEIPSCVPDSVNCTKDFLQFKKEDVELYWIDGTGWNAYYKCRDGYDQRDENKATCKADGTVELPTIYCVPRIEKCDFPDNLEKINAVKERQDNYYAQYRCMDGYRQDGGSNHMSCNSETGELNQVDMYCISNEWDDYSDCRDDNGNDNGDDNGEGDGDDDGKCQLPDHIGHGKIAGRDDHGKRGWYQCDNGYVLVNNEMMNDAVNENKDLYAQGFCKDGKPILPMCVPYKSVCHLPPVIWGGYQTFRRGKLAWYNCSEGFEMRATHNFGEANFAFCRYDNSSVLPICIPRDNKWELEFKLIGKREVDGGDMGYIATRTLDEGKWTDWALVCGTGGNDFAASAACRSIDSAYLIGRAVSYSSLRGEDKQAMKDARPNDLRIRCTRPRCEYGDVNFYRFESLFVTFDKIICISTNCRLNLLPSGSYKIVYTRAIPR